MTRKQKDFADEYIACGGNGAAAARKAGYAESSAKTRSSKLLRRDDVRSAIDTRLDELQSEKIAEQTEIMEFLTRIIRGQEYDDVVTNSGKLVTIRVNCAARLKACEMLLKIYGAFNQRDDDDKPTGDSLFVRTLEKIWQEKQDKDEESQLA